MALLLCLLALTVATAIVCTGHFPRLTPLLLALLGCITVVLLLFLAASHFLLP